MVAPPIYTNMIKLEVGNSESKVEGLSIEQTKALQEILSYKLPPKYTPYGGMHSEKRYLLTKKGTFSTGLLPYVHRYLSNFDYATLDTRKQPISKPGMFKAKFDYEPYPEQLEIVDSAVKFHRGTISAVTGFGKSISMALLVNALQVRTLIVVPNLTLKKQLTESFINIFGKLDNITIENIDSSKLKKANNYDMLIIDEAHHSASKTYRLLNKTSWKNIYYRFFFTGTAFRSREEENILLESIAGQLIYSIDYHKAVEKGYIVPVEFYYYDTSSLSKVSRGQYEGLPWAKVYNTLVVNNNRLNDTVASIVQSLSSNGISTLVLVKEIKHGEIISELARLQFANGESDDSEDIIRFFNEGKLKAIVGTTGVVGEGVDTKPSEFIIIAGLGKSKNQLIQQIGRGIRKFKGKESCKVIIFLNNDHKWLKSHFKEQCKIIRDIYGAEPVLLE